MIDFTEEQIQRYSRHILLQDVGVEGQEKIMNARVLVVGAGGLGAPVSLYLAAAGIGRIGIVDADVVDLPYSLFIYNINSHPCFWLFIYHKQLKIFLAMINFKEELL